MAVQAQLVCRLSELGNVLWAMNIVTGTAGDTILVHHALHKVIALHPVLVCGSVREVRECRLTQGDVFKLPIVLKMKTDTVANRPVVSFALDLFGEWLAL